MTGKMTGRYFNDMQKCARVTNNRCKLQQVGKRIVDRKKNDGKIRASTMTLTTVLFIVQFI